MQKRRLGKSNLEVTALGLGCMGMSYSYAPIPDRKDMIKLLHAAVGRSLCEFLFCTDLVTKNAQEI